MTKEIQQNSWAVLLYRNLVTALITIFASQVAFSSLNVQPWGPDMWLGVDFAIPFVFLWGPSALFGLPIGIIVSQVSTPHPPLAEWGMQAFVAPVLSLVGIAAALLAYRIIRPRPGEPLLCSIRPTARFLLLGVLFPALLAGIASAIVLVLTGVSSPSTFMRTCAVWGSGCTCRALVDTPLLLAWCREPLGFRKGKLEKAIFAALLIAFTAVALLVFSGILPVSPQLQNQLPYLTFPVLGIIILRYGFLGASSANLCAAIIANICADNGQGPFGDSPYVSANFPSQLYLFVLSASGILLAAALYERREATNKLRSNEAALSAFFNAVKESLIIHDAKGTVLAANPTAASRFGLTPAEVTGKDIYSLMPPPLGEQRRSHMMKVVKTQEPFLYEDERAGRHYTATLFPVHDSQHVFEGVAIFAQDNTDRKRAEDALRTSEGRLRLLVNQAPAIIWTTDRALVITSMEGAGLRQSGIDPKTAIGKEISSVIGLSSPMGETFTAGANAVQGHSTSYEETIGDRYYQGHIEPLRDDEQRIIGCLGLWFDITDRKALERQLLEISDREQRRLGSDLHDGLGQHLSGVLYLARALSISLTNHAPALTSRMEEIVALLRQGIAQTRDLAKGLHPFPCTPEGFLAGMSQLAATTSNLYGIKCVFEHHGAVVMQDEAMTTHLYRVAQEAIRNAVHHGHAKNVIITLERINGQCELRIRDNGRGIAPKVFEKGGMGMRIMEYRARILGGHVTIGPHLDGGVQVVCTFPIKS